VIRLLYRHSCDRELIHYKTLLLIFINFCHIVSIWSNVTVNFVRYVHALKTERLTRLTATLRGFESASELYRSSDRRRSAKLVPTLADRGCHDLRLHTWINAVWQFWRRTPEDGHLWPKHVVKWLINSNRTELHCDGFVIILLVRLLNSIILINTCTGMWRRVQVMKFFVVQFSPTSYHFIYPCYQCSSRQSVLKYLQLI
jgi:hypothetical protein